MFVPLLFAASLLAVAPSDGGTTRRAVLDVVTRTSTTTSCDRATLRKAVRDATIVPIGRLGNDLIVTAEVRDPCMCGIANCPEYVIRTGAHPRALLQESGLEIKALRVRAAALPNIVTTAKDSAAVYVETTYAFRGGSYVRIRSANVRADTR